LANFKIIIIIVYVCFVISYF